MDANANLIRLARIDMYRTIGKSRKGLTPKRVTGSSSSTEEMKLNHLIYRIKEQDRGISKKVKYQRRAAEGKFQQQSQKIVTQKGQKPSHGMKT